MTITMNKKDLAEKILNVKVDNVNNYIKRKTLDKQLLKRGYRLIETKKKGKYLYFIIEDIAIFNENDECIGIDMTYDEYKESWKIRKDKDLQHLTYCFDRCCSDGGLHKNVGSILGSHEELDDLKYNTARRWDDKMLDAKIIDRDGFEYVIIYNDGRVEPTTKEFYNDFWKNRNGYKKFQDETLELISKELAKGTEEGKRNARQLLEMHGDVTNQVYNNVGYIVRKWRVYKKSINYNGFEKSLIETYENKTKQ